MRQTAVRRLVLIGALLVAGSVVWTGFTGAPAPALAQKPAEEKERVTVRVDWAPLGYHAPLQYAVAQGYYAAEGLEVTVLTGPGSGPGLVSLISGDIEFGLFDATTMVRYVLDRAPLKMIMGLFQSHPSAIVSFKDQNITKPEHLVGKRLAAGLGSANQMIWPAVAKAAGVDPAKVNFIGVSAAALLATLLEGKADAIMSFTFIDEPILKRKGAKEINIIPSSDYVNLRGLGIVTRHNVLEKKPETVKRFLRATIKGYEEAQKNPEKAIEALKNRFPDELKGKETAYVEVLVASYRYTRTKRTADKPFGWMSEDDWKENLQVMFDTGMIGRKPETKDVYTNDYRP